MLGIFTSPGEGPCLNSVSTREDSGWSLQVTLVPGAEAPCLPHDPHLGHSLLSIWAGTSAPERALGQPGVSYK